MGSLLGDILFVETRNMNYKSILFAPFVILCLCRNELVGYGRILGTEPAETNTCIER